MIFENIDIGMKPRVDEYLRLADTMAAEYCFGNMFIWKDKVKTAVSFSENGMIVRIVDNAGPGCLYPVSRNKAAAIKEIAGMGFRILYGVGESELEFLKNLNAVESVSNERDTSDYIYRRKDIAELSGKKYHSKRNFVNSFRRLYPDFELSRINSGNIADCMQMEDRWLLTFRSHEVTEEMCQEKRAIQLSLEYYEELCFDGMILKAGGETVAFCAGEYLNEDCFVVHIEKANSDYRGAYAFINNAFVRTLGCKYINREDDLGISGLRKAKESYHPAFMINKYTVTLKEKF